MAANTVIYCLDELTDYTEFENLSDDLMVREGYSSLEPLGGFSDRGRDAIHVSKSKKTTIFAYSVREDWRAKLAEDAAKIEKNGHTCNTMVFVTTSNVSSTERDEAVNTINNRYGWRLELYAQKRLRILIQEKNPDLIARYPQIFNPDFFTKIQSQTKTSSDHIFIHYSPNDSILGDWLTLKLTGEGYRVWSSGNKVLVEDNSPENIDAAIKNGIIKMISIYSYASTKDQEIVRQRAIALSHVEEGKKDFVIPVTVNKLDLKQLDKISASLEGISFQENWATGLSDLLSVLESTNTPKPLLNGRSIVANSYLGKDILLNKSEQLVSNCLKIERIPDTIYCVITEKKLSDSQYKTLQSKWAFKKIGFIYLSFQTPPEDLYEYEFELSSSLIWRDHENIEGVKTSNVVSELLRRSLMIKCYSKGLLRCETDNYIYFPKGIVTGDKIPYIKPDGQNNKISVTGKRKYWRPSATDYYVYSLSPTFSIKQNLIDEFLVLLKIRVRISDTNNVILDDKPARSRRKHLCRDWWNDHWLKRMLAVCKFLADDDGKIIIGNVTDDQIIINANPILIKSPTAINESMLNEDSIQKEEILEEEVEDNE